MLVVHLDLVLVIEVHLSFYKNHLLLLWLFPYCLVALLYCYYNSLLLYCYYNKAISCKL